jgi:hypothetical protein
MRTPLCREHHTVSDPGAQEGSYSRQPGTCSFLSRIAASRTTMSRCSERRMLQTLLATGEMTHTKIVPASVNRSSLKDFWLAVVALIAARLSPVAHIHRAPRLPGRRPRRRSQRRNSNRSSLCARGLLLPLAAPTGRSKTTYLRLFWLARRRLTNLEVGLHLAPWAYGTPWAASFRRRLCSPLRMISA